MKPLRISLVNLTPPVAALVREAAGLAFPAPELQEAPPTAADLPPADLIVLGESDEALVAAATQATDAAGLPRWAVVLLGPAASDVAEAVPAEEWQPRSLARALRCAHLQHTLLRDNLRLRGDLKSVARRFSHELRSPIGCIYTSADLLREAAVGRDALVDEVVEVFRQSSAEISSLVDRISFLLHASADPLPPSPVEMGTVVAAVLRQLEDDIRRTSAVVSQPDTWPTVTGVAAWLHVIWWNLLHNALRHGGPVPRIHLAWEADGAGYRFSVDDSGPGVPATREAGLFAPFEGLHTVRGAGLGLSIVQRLVFLQGGRCSHEVPAPTGARFHFSLP